MTVHDSRNAVGSRRAPSDFPLLPAGGDGALTPRPVASHRSETETNLFLTMADDMDLRDVKRFGATTGRLANL